MDSFRNPVQLLERFLSLSKESVVTGGDQPPTVQQIQVYKKLVNQLTTVKNAYEKLITVN